MLIDWINDVLVGERIIVKDLAEDLYDGQVLQKLFGNLTFDTLLWFDKEFADGSLQMRAGSRWEKNLERWRYELES